MHLRKTLPLLMAAAAAPALADPQPGYRCTFDSACDAAGGCGDHPPFTQRVQREPGEDNLWLHVTEAGAAEGMALAGPETGTETLVLVFPPLEGDDGAMLLTRAPDGSAVVSQHGTSPEDGRAKAITYHGTCEQG
jgi:hypothetical protein